jgi:hypothetical protein
MSENGCRTFGMTRPLASDHSPWQRQPGETQRAYVAFTSYRDMGPNERSIRAVARTLHRSVTLIGRWSARWGWVVRADQWDDAMAKETERQAREHARAQGVCHEQLARSMIVTVETLVARLNAKLETDSG